MFGYLILLGLFVVFGPVASMKVPVGATFEEHNYYLLIDFYKTAFTMVCCLIIIFGRNFSLKFKNTFSILFGFKENPFLLNFGILAMMMASYSGIGELIDIVRTYTNSIDTTLSYLVIQVMLIAGLGANLFLCVKQAKNMNISNMVHVVREDKNINDEKPLSGLFEEIKEEEKVF